MIKVLSIPPLATVQDLGRVGQWRQGLGRSGAMDSLAHRLANLLLGNDENDATLEIPLTPALFEIVADGPISLVGAACGATLDGVALPRIWAGQVVAGQKLHLGAIKDGARVYLGLLGGIDVPIVLASRSTQLREAFGGLDGRVLSSGDVLAPLEKSRIVTPMSYALPPLKVNGIIPLRVLASTETDEFTPMARESFFSKPYRITPAANRQGYRLEGPMLERAKSGELRSHGIAPGIVQVPGNGQPIIQLADSATMGGYPKIACVIEPDLWKLGQARPGDQVTFDQVDLAGAHRAHEEEAHMLDEMRAALTIAGHLHRSWI